MTNVRVTQEQIDNLLDNADVEVKTVFGKCTVVTVKLENGFILSEATGCVDEANYSEEIGAKICRERIENKLWELEGYVLQKKIHEESGCECESKDETPAVWDFGSAIRAVKAGCKVRRRGWNGKNQYIELASNISYVDRNGRVVNCEHDAIGNQAVAFVGTSGTQMGWLASQSDMLAEDWELAY